MSTKNNNFDFEVIKTILLKKCDLTTISYRTWIEPLQLHNVEGEIVYVTVPMDRSRAIPYIEAKYKSKFEEILLENGFPYKLVIMVK